MSYIYKKSGKEMRTDYLSIPNVLIKRNNVFTFLPEATVPIMKWAMRRSYLFKVGIRIKKYFY